MRKKKVARGATLVEVLVASAVLLIGFSGSSILLLKGAELAGNGAKSVDSAVAINDALAELGSIGYQGLAGLVASNNVTQADAGLVVIGDREYRRTYDLISRSDGGQGLIELRVRLTYRDYAGVEKVRTGSAFLSEAPDASF